MNQRRDHRDVDNVCAYVEYLARLFPPSGSSSYDVIESPARSVGAVPIDHRDNVPRQSFKTWFEPISPLRLEEDDASLRS
jgi:hypothetical protein